MSWVVSVAVVTLGAHSMLTLLVLGHARWTGRNVGYWPLLTLVFGVGGVVGYVLTGNPSGSDRNHETEEG